METELLVVERPI